MCLEDYGHIVEPFHVNNLLNFIEKDLCMTRQQSFNVSDDTIWVIMCSR